MAIWDRFEDLVLEFMENRVSEMLDQGDVASPKVIAHVRETAAWAAERAVARFQAGNGVQKPGKKAQNH
jgi:predicted phage gp36 major capsid-like protein